MRTTWTFHSAGKIVFGPSAAEQVGELARELGLKRLLIVTDPPLVAVGTVEQIRKTLVAAGIEVEVFAHGEPEPSFAAAERCQEHAARFLPDGIVGLGGGSNMDLAKVVALLAKFGGHPRQLVGDARITAPGLPVICLPTTAGTGSEISASAVLTDHEQHLKVGILSNHMRPTLSIVDPKLTLSCPRKVTADSGIDALVHAIEAFTAVDNADFPLPPGERTIYQGRHPLGEALAEKAIRLIGANLVLAVEQPNNLEARTAMSLAAMLAGMAFSNVGVALVHALEYPLGGLVHCSHGAGNGLLLPYVMRYNMPAREAEFAQIAALLGVNTAGMSQSAAAAASIEFVETLRQRIGIPTHLHQLGLLREQIPPLAEKTHSIQRILRVNPRMPSVADLKGILSAAF